jgi:cell division protein FtsN
MLRVRWAKLQVGMAYDLPAVNALVSTGGTQEIQLSYRFGPSGEKKASKKSKPVDKAVIEQVKPLKSVSDSSTQVQKEKTDVKDKDQNPVEKQPAAVLPQEAPKEEGSFYLIVGSFKILDNAEKLVARLAEMGIKAEIKESQRGDPHYFYVHLPQYKSDDSIDPDILIKLRDNPEFIDAWIKRIR